VSFNIFDLAAAEHATIPVIHPVTKVPTGATITIAGPASDEYGAQKARLAKVLEQGAMTPEQTQLENAKFLAGCVTGWDGMGQEFSPETAVKILTDKHQYPFRNWLDAEVMNVANFIKA
jgi:hypothetical protein